MTVTEATILFANWSLAAHLARGIEPVQNPPSYEEITTAINAILGTNETTLAGAMSRAEYAITAYMETYK